MYKYISVVVSTYNSPKWLENVLIGYNCQNYRFFELIIADDGSSQETFDLIEKYRSICFFNIQHVWHEDDGFRKTEILNKALLKAKYDYVIFSDGDCIPRIDFVETHFKNRELGYFLSGGYHKLSMEISNSLTHNDIISGKCFDLKILKERGMKSSFKNNKLTNNTLNSFFLNLLTPTKPTWNGHNASGWKQDILDINGFDEQMKYGGEDLEMGIRLNNNGIQSKQIRYSAICVHLDHSRGYVNQKDLDNNRRIKLNTIATKSTWTEHGIVKKELLQMSS